MAENKKFSGYNANRLEIKQRAQRGMTFLILTYTFVMAAKKLNFFGEKKVQIFVKNTKLRFLSKMRNFFSLFPL